jgi:adenylate cyclase
MDYTIVGTPVNIAARLQDAGEAGSILVSRNTHALVADTFTFDALGPLTLKGFVDDVDTCKVRFDPAGEAGPNDQAPNPVEALKAKLAEIDIDSLNAEEKAALLKTMSELLEG